MLVIAIGTGSPMLKAEEHPIDAFLTSCLAKDTTTAGMVQCTDLAYRRWDEELNRQYRQLMARLSGSDQTVLRDAQRRWLAWRDTEFALIDALYRPMQGTMYSPMQLADRLEIVKNRTLELAAYNQLRND